MSEEIAKPTLPSEENGQSVPAAALDPVAPDLPYDNTLADASIQDTSDGPSPETSARYQRDAVGVTVLYFLFNMILPLIKLPGILRAPAVLFFLTIITTALFMYFQVLLARSIVRLRRKTAKAAWLTLVCTVLWILVLLFFRPYHSILLQLVVLVLKPPLLGLLLTLGLTNLGTVVSRIIREPNVLFPVAFVAMPIDYLGAMAPKGFTHDAMTHAPNLVKQVMVKVPTFQGVDIVPLIGPGDVLFIAFFLMAVQTMRMNEAGTFRLIYLLLTLTMLFIIISPIPIPIAALIPMGLAVLIANWRYFQLNRSEVFAMFYAMGIVLMLVVSFYLLSHKYLFGGK